MERLYKNINFSLEEIEIFNFDKDSCKIEYRKLTPSNEFYHLLIIDAHTRAIIHSEELQMHQGYDHYTWFNYAKDLITNNVYVRFYRSSQGLLGYTQKQKQLVYSKKIVVHDENNYSYVSDFCFDEDQILGNLIEIYGQQTYINDTLPVKIEPNDIVVDLGANTGVAIMHALDMGAKKIYACEPNEECVKILKKYFQDNSKVHLNELALSDVNGHTNLQIGHNMPTSVHSKLTTVERLKNQVDTDFYDNCSIKTVTAITLKSFFDLHELNFVDFLKVDIEGAEILLISEENKNILSERVRKVALEFHNEECKKDLTTFLESINFHVDIDTDLSMLYALNRKHAKSN